MKERTELAIEITKALSRALEICNSTADIGYLHGSATNELRDLLLRNKEMVTDLLRELEQLRVQNLLLEKQKSEAEKRIDVTTLGKENRQLKAELDLLNERLAESEAKFKKYRYRYENLEQHNMSLSSAFTASSNLHETLDFSEVVKTAHEILWNLIASPVFAIFIYDERTKELSLISGEGLENKFASNCIKEPTGMMAQALDELEAQYIEGTTKGDPLACIPLVLDNERVIGLIAIYEVEQHKGGISESDKELFELIARQTATAFTSSRVYGETVKKLKATESFLNLIKPAST
jgi:hypothetical protein